VLISWYEGHNEVVIRSEEARNQGGSMVVMRYRWGSGEVVIRSR
jgi:hypothetical protein